MTKALLALLLVMTQLFSWSGPALWLCICGSGQTCIVGDPQTCNCCQGHHPQGTPCGEADPCDGDQRCASDHFLSGDDDLLIGRPSGCPHIQLSQHQSAVVVSASFAHDAAGLIPFVAETAGRASVVDVSVCDSRTVSVWLSLAPKLPLVDLACVVLQC